MHKVVHILHFIWFGFCSKPELIKAYADLIRSFVWPLLCVFLAIYFRKNVIRLLDRIEEWKGFGGEIKLRKEVEKLESELTPIENETVPVEKTRFPSAEPEIVTIEFSEGHADQKEEKSLAYKEDRDIDEVMKTLSFSPRSALVLLAGFIEKRVRTLVKAIDPQTNPSVSFQQNIRLLAKQNLLPPPLVEAAHGFWRVRNRLVHGYSEENDLIYRTIDVGITILRALDLRML